MIWAALRLVVSAYDRGELFIENGRWFCGSCYRRVLLLTVARAGRVCPCRRA